MVRSSNYGRMHTPYTDTMIGTIPLELCKLASLSQLLLSFNSFSGTISGMLGNLVNLTSLQLMNNNLSGNN